MIYTPLSVLKRRIKIKKLYVDGQLILTIKYDPDLRIDEVGEEPLTISDYLMDVITSNMYYDNIYEDTDYDYKWVEED